jgi:non-specific serine/threonine protein kinase
MVDVLLNFAALSALEGRPAQAALLFGAADAQIELMGLVLDAPDRAEFGAIVAQARARLSDAAWYEAHQHGRSMPLHEAMAALEPLLNDPPAQTAGTATMPGGLTEREREVAALIAASKSNVEIAGILVISKRTVETHIGNILSKLGFTSRGQIAAWAIRNRLDGGRG